MKELSIEEKAKRYDEALKAAVVAHKDEDKHLKATLERIFPELKEKESEDEKIRKELIEYLKERKSCESYGQYVVRYDRWIAWLEKQGKKLDDKVELSAFKDKLLELFQRFRWYCKDETPTNGDVIEYVDANIQELLDTIQKPVDKVEPKFKVGDKIKLAIEPKYPAREIIAIKNDAYYFDKAVHLPFSRQDEWELVEQKPWSEEDDDDAWLNDIISKVECNLQLNKGEIDFLKNLKDRAQPKREWSEEDENHVKSILSTIEWVKAHFTKAPVVAEAYNADIEWLKSLRPQSAWKPSDEQIYWLKWATGRMPDTEKANEAEAVLEELLEQLKKLMEE